MDDPQKLSALKNLESQITSSFQSNLGPSYLKKPLAKKIEISCSSPSLTISLDMQGS